MKIRYLILALSFIINVGYSQNDTSVVSAVSVLNESPESFNQRMEWWRDSKFGMFIHWGVYAVPAGVYNGEKIDGGGEWIMKTGQIPADKYEEFAHQFNPEKFDAKEWVKTAKDAGMKYIVITSKHHDGFALWDSEVSNYNIVDYAPYGKDVLKELSQACRKAGLKFGVYYSIMDWHHINAQLYSYLDHALDKSRDNKENFAKYFNEYMIPQVKEIVNGYHPDIMWFDGEWISNYTHEQGVELYTLLREMDPDLIINNRVDKGRDGLQGMNKGDQKYMGDFGTPEQEILDTKTSLDWESCMTMNDTWGYKKDDDNWKSAGKLVHNLIDVTVKGGNYLLNVGPTAEGLIPKESISRLNCIGHWMSTNNEAIYKTEKMSGSYHQGDDIMFSKKKDENIYYAYIMSRPKRKIILYNLKPKEGSQIALLGARIPINWEWENHQLIIHFPKELCDSWRNTSSYAWVLKIEGEEIK